MANSENMSTQLSVTGFLGHDPEETPHAKLLWISKGKGLHRKTAGSYCTLLNSQNIAETNNC